MLRDIWLGKSLALAMLLACSAHVLGSDPWRPEGIVAARIGTRGEPIVVSVEIDGRDFPFVVDTGASHTLLDSSLLDPAKRLGQVVRGPGTHGMVEAPLYHAPRICVADFEFNWIKEVPALDFRPFRAAGVQAYGVLGMDFLSRTLVHLNFDEGLLLLDDGTVSSRPQGKTLALKYDTLGRPCVELHFKDARGVPFLIDTGDIGTGMIDVRLAELLKRTGNVQMLDVWDRRLGAGGVDTVQKILSLDSRLADFRHRDLVFDSNRQNALGLGFLCRYNVTFDFAQSALILSPSKKFDLSDRNDGLGITRREGERSNVWVIARVGAGSRAAAAGLSEGDRLIAINGRQVADLLPTTVWRLLHFPTSEDIILTVDTGMQRRDVRIPGG